MPVRKREKRLLTAEFGKRSAFSFLVYESERWSLHINTLREPGVWSELHRERSLRARGAKTERRKEGDRRNDEQCRCQSPCLARPDPPYVASQRAAPHCGKRCRHA